MSENDIEEELEEGKDHWEIGEFGWETLKIVESCECEEDWNNDDFDEGLIEITGLEDVNLLHIENISQF